MSMRIGEVTPTPDLRSIVTWQYDKAENLQRLIWKKDYVSKGADDSDSSAAELEQTGLFQRMCENVTQFENDFHTYIFDAVNLALREDVDAWDDDSIEKKRITFGLGLWARLVGIGRPQYVSSGVVHKVKLRTWAMYIKATIFKLRMNGSLYDVNRYTSILMPDIGIAVTDPSLDGDQLANDKKMTLSYGFATDDGKHVDAGSRCSSFSPYVMRGCNVGISLKIGFSVDTAESKFSGVSVAPVMTLTDENGDNTYFIGSVENCKEYGVGASSWFGVADIRLQLPVAARPYVSRYRVIVETSNPPRVSMEDPNATGSRKQIDLDSIVTPVKDQNGNVVDYVFIDSDDPLQGLPDWVAYTAKKFPEYSEILQMGKTIFPYPAGVGDGESDFSIKSANGRYLGLSEAASVGIPQAFKYTLDRSVLYPAEYVNPPSDAWK